MKRTMRMDGLLLDLAAVGVMVAPLRRFGR